MKDKYNTSVYAMWCNKSDFLYIGISNAPFKRYKQHISLENDLFNEVAKKYGEESIMMVVLKSDLSKEDARAYEAGFIYEAIWKGVKLLNIQVPTSYYFNRYLSLLFNSNNINSYAFKEKVSQLPDGSYYGVAWRKGIDFLPSKAKRELLKTYI